MMRLLLTMLLAVLLVAGCAAAAPPRAVPPVSGPAPPAGAFRARVVRVVDGDTFVARVDGAGPSLRVRVIGVDTPETVRPGTPVRCYGKQASAYTHRALTGRWVQAAYEPGGHLDRYGRQLWDVWLPDGQLLAADLAAGGYARAYPFPPQTVYAALLRRLADQARAARRGLWGPPCHGDSFGR